MSFIIETLYGAEDRDGKAYLKWLGPFVFKKDAQDWGDTHIDGTFQIHELTDQRSLRRG